MRNIRALWIAGNAGLLAALVLPTPAHLIVMAISDVVLAVAWVAVICHAIRSGEGAMACAMAIFPLSVWWYAFIPRVAPQETPQRQEADQDHATPRSPTPAPLRYSHREYFPGMEDFVGPYPMHKSVPPADTLAIREAEKLIREAEERFPDW